MAPKVYFTDFATRNYETLPKELARLILTAGNACTAGLKSLHYWVPLGIVTA